MKNLRRREVVKFLTEQGFVVKSDDGIHTKWVIPDHPAASTCWYLTRSSPYDRESNRFRPRGMEVNKVKTYSITVTREGNWWMVAVPEIDGLTQARDLDEIEEMGRSLIHIMTDQPADSFAMNITVKQPADVGSLLADAATKEAEAREMASIAARERREAVTALRDRYGIKARDTARLLGITRARVYQLLEN